jgi:hypothetical protein
LLAIALYLGAKLIFHTSWPDLYDMVNAVIGGPARQIAKALKTTP